jgi:hypothetical protein
LTTTFYVGDKQVDHLTPEQIRKMEVRLSETMTAYYAAHPEEFARL